jgi:hypothetical protein
MLQGDNPGRQGKTPSRLRGELFPGACVRRGVRGLGGRLAPERCELCRCAADAQAGRECRALAGSAGVVQAEQVVGAESAWPEGGERDGGRADERDVLPAFRGDEVAVRPVHRAVGDGHRADDRGRGEGGGGAARQGGARADFDRGAQLGLQPVLAEADGLEPARRAVECPGMAEPVCDHGPAQGAAQQQSCQLGRLMTGAPGCALVTHYVSLLRPLPVRRGCRQRERTPAPSHAARHGAES